MRKPILATVLVSALSLALGVAAFGCGGDSSTTTTGAGASGGAGGTAGTGGAGGTGGFACAAGETQSCYSGAAGTQGVGQCKAGTSTCTDGQWSECVGEVVPGAESCNGIDEDCDGQVDNGIAPITCGLGACQVTVECVDGMMPACEPLPPATGESCDGSDDDCDGTIDEDCSCVDGKTQACYSGSDATKDVGACKSGTQVCANGQWGACDGEVLPGMETCDSVDNDCDGTVDDDLGELTCGAGACLVTVPSCKDGMPNVCTPGQPQPEMCNNIDDDCNLFVDDNLGTITCGIGACTTVVPSCAGGEVQSCMPGAPAPEICDGIDNNCNGTTDENNPGGGGACMTGQPGECSAGTQVCTGGSLQCAAVKMPSPELCDSKDNDCDGQTDEGNPGGGMACNTQQLGVCAAGTTNCNNGSVVCTQNTQQSPEVCDGLDNNCNGASDEGNPGSGATCTVPNKVGPCAQGVLNCTNGAPTCTQTVFPAAESCNGIDDNCNGTVDEGNPQSGGSCTTPLPGVCSAGTFQCQNGALVCTQSQQASAEICDNKDNDCDGSIDEGNPGGGQMCNTGKLGICAVGTSACSLGTIICNQNSLPGNEVCDGLDNNCNGATDEGNPGGGMACTVAGQLGECAKSTTVCTAGALTCPKTVNATTETCDGKDNDCNGTIDNGTTGAACTASGALGECAKGTTTCTNGVGGCMAGAPTAEVCDNKDNNCNGSVDDGNPGGGASCTVAGQLGPCATGALTCSAGTITCSQTVFPTTEVCGDSIDNDCNGVVNNGCSVNCAHSVCQAGAPLTQGCGGNSCVTSVCTTVGFEYCCTSNWDNGCTALADFMSTCTTKCCAHNVCTTGAALNASCSSCVAAVCAADPFCCTIGWDQTCVDSLPTYCNVQCN